MLNNSLRAAAFVGITLSAMSGVANAGFSTHADPFWGNSAGVVLQTGPGTLVELPGLTGAGGAQLYASTFNIGSFLITHSDTNYGGATDGGDILTNTYSASFTSSLVYGDGSSSGITVALATDATHHFVVSYDDRTGAGDVGTFVTHLTEATFVGTVPGSATPFVVSLANSTSATIDIEHHLGGGYDINYISAYTVNGQYSINGGSNVPTPGLGDANGQPASSVPEPATALLMVPGLLALARRRRAAVAA